MLRNQFHEIFSQLEERSPAKIDVIKKLLEGKTEQEIADMRDTSPGTIRKQISQLYEAFSIESFPGIETQRNQLIDLFKKYKPEWVSLSSPLITMPAGALLPEDQRYLQRDTDRELIDIINENNQLPLFIKIRGAKGTGKSTTLWSLQQFLRLEQGLVVALVKVGSSILSKQVFERFNSFLYQFTYEVVHEFNKIFRERELELPDLDEHFENAMSPQIACTRYLNDYVFSQFTQAKTLLIDIDDIGYLLEHKSIIDQFFALLKYWNNEQRKRVNLHQEVILPNIVISVPSEIDIENYRASPLYKTGISIELNSFSAAEIKTQAKKYGLNLSKQEIQKLIDLLDGNPELTNIALKTITQEGMEIESLFSNLKELQDLFYDHLDLKKKVLERNPDLKRCFSQIHHRDECNNTNVGEQLRKLGLVKLNEYNGYIISCHFYDKYLSKYLLVSEVKSNHKENFSEEKSRDYTLNYVLNNYIQDKKPWEKDINDTLKTGKRDLRLNNSKTYEEDLSENQLSENNTVDQKEESKNKKIDQKEEYIMVSSKILNRDVFILVDQSESMNKKDDPDDDLNRWETLKGEILKGDIRKILKFEREKQKICDRIELYLFSRNRIGRDFIVEDPDDIDSIFEEHHPDSATYITPTLEKCITDWLDNGRKNDKGAFIIIYSDGRLNDKTKFQKLVSATCRKLENQDELKIIIIGIGKEVHEDPTYYLDIDKNLQNNLDKNSNPCDVFVFDLVDKMDDIIEILDRELS